MLVISRSLTAAALLALGASTAIRGAASEPGAEDAAFFESKIRPILADNC